MGLLLVRAALIAAAALALFQAVPLSAATKQGYGRDLLSEHELPIEDVQRYATQIGATGQPAAVRERWNVGSMWVGPLQSLGVGRNPYTLVVTVSGTAREAGDVRTHWQSGWEMHETASAVREMVMPMSGLSSGRVNAGAPVTLTIAGGPISFRGERRGAPLLNLVSAKNIDIERVKLQIWSGPAPTGVLEMGWMRPALVALGLACLAGWYLMHRAAAPRAPFTPTQTSRPVPDDETPSTRGDAPATDRPAPAMVPSTLPGMLPSQPMRMNAVASPELEAQPLPTAILSTMTLPALNLPTATQPTATLSADAAVLPPLPWSAVTTPEPVAPASATARVAASLRDVLARGLVMPAEPDLARRSRRRRAA